MTYLLILLLLAFFPLPWIWVGCGRCPGEASEVDWIDSVCVGFGIAFCVLYLCSHHSLSLFKWIWLASLAVGISMVTMRFKRTTVSNVRRRSEFYILILSLGLYVVIRAAPLAVAEYPLGWDPYFHLVLADKILRAGRFITDWRPFENIQLNYPIASHLLLAIIGEIGRVPVHKVFTVALIMFTGLTGAQVYALITRATEKPEVGLYASLSYLFLAVYGSIDYTRWGGLPNLIGMYLILGLLSMLHRKYLPEHKIIAVVAVLFLAASLVHHHVMVTAGCILLWQLFYFRWIRPDYTQTRRLTAGLALTAIIGAPYFAGYLLETSMLKETGIVGYVEPLMSPYVTMNVLGPAFFFSVLIGVLIFLNRQSKLYVSASIQQTILSLLVIYFLLQYVSSLVSLALIGRVVSPFTPSRFLSDCVTLLSVFSALLFFQLKTWLGKSKVWIASLIVAGFVLNWPIYRETFHGTIPEERLQAYEWIRTKTPADTIIIDDAIQTSYLTQRISSSMPIPTSEFLDMATNQKMTREINQGKIPPAAQRRQILFVTKGSPPAFAAGREVWSHPSGLHIIGLQLDETVK